MRYWWNRFLDFFRKDDAVVYPTPERKPVPVEAIFPVEVKEISKTDIKKRTVMYYEYLYAKMEITAPKVVERVVARIERNKSRYMSASLLTGVDWRVIGVIHNLEASGNFDRQILNGERWSRRTRLVPKRMGPWASWEESCVDAFNYHKLKTNRIGDVLKFLEKYNGLGYIRKGINSPYIWSYTNHYTSGKYVADGKYSSYAVSKQVGGAPTLKLLGY